MKTISSLLLCLVVITMASCDPPLPAANKPLQDFENMAPPDTAAISEAQAAAGTMADSLKILETLYVTNRGGLRVWQQADSSTEASNTYEYGDRLEVLEEKGDWLGVLDNKSNYRGTKVYALKSLLGNISAIRLMAEELDVISSFTTIDSVSHREDRDTLSHYLKAELIDEALYLSKKSSAVDFLVQDTLAIRKKNGIIDLPCKNKHCLFKDHPSDGDDLATYNYVGHIDLLDAYVVQGAYWEDYDFIFTDRTTGEELQRIQEFPRISPDKKYMLCLYANPYDESGDLELYSLKGKHIKHLIDESFKSWLPANDEQMPIFWSRDGYLYLPVLHRQVYWEEIRNLKEHAQYMRIKILNS